MGSLVHELVALDKTADISALPEAPGFVTVYTTEQGNPRLLREVAEKKINSNIH